MIVGDIAWKQLTDEAKAKVRDILGSETLFYAATWPDRVRGQEEYDWIAPYHYVNVPRGAAAYNQDRDCTGNVCVVGGILANTKILRDGHARKAKKKQALRLLAHFVGDVHQPLHVDYIEDRGGNGLPVKFFGREFLDSANEYPVNLHNVWDSLVIGRRMEQLGDFAWDDYAQRLNSEITDADGQAWTNPSTNSVLSWADASYQRARIHAYRDTTSAGTPSPATEIRANDDLRDAYYDQALPITERALKEGGIRLATILNSVFSTQDVLPFGLAARGESLLTGMV